MKAQTIGKFKFFLRPYVRLRKLQGKGVDSVATLPGLSSSTAAGAPGDLRQAWFRPPLILLNKLGVGPGAVHGNACTCLKCLRKNLFLLNLVDV